MHGPRRVADALDRLGTAVADLEQVIEVRKSAPGLSAIDSAPLQGRHDDVAARMASDQADLARLRDTHAAVEAKLDHVALTLAALVRRAPKPEAAD